MQIVVFVKSDPTEFFARITSCPFDRRLTLVKVSDTFAAIVKQQFDVSIGKQSHAGQQ